MRRVKWEGERQKGEAEVDVEVKVEVGAQEQAEEQAEEQEKMEHKCKQGEEGWGGKRREESLGGKKNLYLGDCGKRFCLFPFGMGSLVDDIIREVDGKCLPQP